MKRVVLPAVASVVMGGVVSLAAVLAVTASAEVTVRPSLVTSDGASTTVSNDVTYGNR